MEFRIYPNEYAGASKEEQAAFMCGSMFAYVEVRMLAELIIQRGYADKVLLYCIDEFGKFLDETAAAINEDVLRQLIEAIKTKVQESIRISMDTINESDETFINMMKDVFNGNNTKDN